MNLKNLYKWVPSLYLMEGLPYALVCVVSPILYKSLNLSNSKTALYTSLFAAPWFLKPILSPLLELISSKQKMILTMQFLMVFFSLLLAMSFNLTHFFYLSGAIFFIIALFSSVHDVNADGLYITNLNTKEQAYFIGIRTLAYQVGRLLCQTGLVFIAGMLFVYFNKQETWSISLLLFSIYIFMIAIYHKRILPTDAVPIEKLNKSWITAINSFRNVFKELVQLKNIIAVILFTVFFNFPEAQLMKIVPLFLLDKENVGGVGLSVGHVGLIYGGIGCFTMLCGIFLASFLLSKISFKKMFMPVTILACASNIFYVLFVSLALKSVIVISLIIIITQFCYGLSNAVFMLFLLNVFTRNAYPMSLYAMGTSLMGLGILLGGAVSGYMQSWLGYHGFFIWIVVAGLLVITISAIQENYEASSL